MSSLWRDLLVFGSASATAAVPVAFFAAAITPPIDPFKAALPAVLPVLAGLSSVLFLVLTRHRSIPLSPRAGCKAALASLVFCALSQSLGLFASQPFVSASVGVLLTLAWALVLFGWYAAFLGAGIGWALQRGHSRAAS